MRDRIPAVRTGQQKGSSDLTIILTGYLACLQTLGYARPTIEDYRRAIEHFFRWLNSRHLTAAQISTEVVRAFLEQHLRRCQCAKPASRDPKTAGSALRLLLKQRIVRQLVSADSSGERLIHRFDKYLVDVCGVAEATRSARRRTALEFLEWRFRNRPIRLRLLCASDLVKFVSFRAKRLRPMSVRVLSDSLRSFLRFLQLRGDCSVGLDSAVPTIHGWNRAKLPDVIDKGKLTRFLSSFDRSSAMGRRDYAMALSMCDLGLRVSEVAQLMLEDLDWHEGTLTLRLNKQRRERKLPLPPRLARAIAAYLRNGRPTSTQREVFLRHRTPVGTLLGNGGVRWAMRRAYDQVGIQATGTHLLRRTFATRLHQRGASLKLIADFLGHSDLGTASVYARVNLKELRSLALPWPRA